MVTAMDVYMLLPQTNCGDCGEASCMAFATKLSEKEASMDLCTELTDEQFKKLDYLLALAVKEVKIGAGDKEIVIGGDEVLYRYELTYYNQTVLAIDLPDDLDDSEFEANVDKIIATEFERTSELLTLDAIALRNKSGNAEKFAAAKKLKNAKYPVFLCTFDPLCLEAALKELNGENPLIYAANENNINEMADLAINYKCPIAIFSPGDLEKMKELSFTLRSKGLTDIVLDPGTLTGDAIGDTLDNFAMIRRLAVEERDEDFRFPILGVPALVKMNSNEDDVALATKEATIAATLINKYADVLILQGTEIWELIPVLTLRQSLYTNPRKPQAVDEGVYEFGDVDENSAVLITTNFALTYYTVEGDLKSGGATCYLLVLDTVGRAVDVAIAGGQFHGISVADLIKESGIEEKVKTRTLVIPRLAASLSGEIEDDTGWDVVVGICQGVIGNCYFISTI